MDEAPAKSQLTDRVARLPWVILVPLGFMVFMLLFYPFRDVFEFDTDEGINLMKGMLVLRGYPLYTAIWNDQPPLFTWLLAGAFRLFGVEVNTGRTLALLFSGLLIGSAIQLMRVNWSLWHAAAGVFVLMLVPDYLKLSVATMIGLPAISLALLSLAALATWHYDHRPGWLILSGAAMALSLLTKIFTGFLAPVLLLGIFIDCYSRWRAERRWKIILTPLLLWLGGCLITVGLAGLFIDPSALHQLFVDHLAARNSALFQEYAESLPFIEQLSDSGSLLVLAGLGAVFAAWRRQWVTMYLAVWMVAAAVLLSQYTPVWYHQLLLVTVPAALLGGIAVVEAVRVLAQIVRTRRFLPAAGLLALVTLLVCGYTLAVRIPMMRSQLVRQVTVVNTPYSAEARDVKLVERIKLYIPSTHWIVTDRPMYAFRAGMAVPPPLAVFSRKRMEAGELTGQELVEIMQAYQPELVLLQRFGDEFYELESYLAQHYELNYNRSRRRLFLRNEQ